MASQERKSALRKKVRGLLVAALRVYLLLLVAVYLLQGKLLYITAPQTLAEVRMQAKADGLALWPQDDAGYQALLYPAPLPLQPNAAALGTVVVFHGNAGTAGQRLHYAQAFAAPALSDVHQHLTTRCGLRTLLVEYPGYGARPAGELSQAALSREGAEIILAAKQQFGGPVFVLGESLGAGVAAQAIALAQASHANAVAGGVLITPWDQLASPAQTRFWFLPVRLLLADGYDSIAALKDFQRPLIVVRAASDSLIPAASTQRLFDALTGPKTLLELPGGHNDWFEHTDAGWWQGLCQQLR